MNLSSVHEGDIVQLDDNAYCLVREKVTRKGRRPRLRLSSLTGNWNPPEVTGYRVTAHWIKSRRRPRNSKTAQ